MYGVGGSDPRMCQDPDELSGIPALFSADKIRPLMALPK